MGQTDSILSPAAHLSTTPPERTFTSVSVCVCVCAVLQKSGHGQRDGPLETSEVSVHTRYSGLTIPTYIMSMCIRETGVTDRGTNNFVSSKL